MRGMSYPEYQVAIRDRMAHAGRQGETAGAAAVAATDLRPYEVGEAGGPYPDEKNIAAWRAALAVFEGALASAVDADLSEEEASAFRYAFNHAFFAPLTIFVSRQSPSR